MKRPKVYYLRSITKVLLLLACMPVLTYAQESREVVISVVDSLNQSPIPGVNVTIKGTNKGSSTNSDGQLKLGVSVTDILVFSFIGYEKKQMQVGNKTSLKVSLKQSQESLNEVVVVGYGTQKKINLTGSVSTIDSKAIENRPVSNLATAMQGTTPGLIVTRTSGQPGAENITMQIRGATSANGNINPLVLLDGVTVPISTLQTMNPNDVESISVLKDAAVAAIYGAQAAGGVILVTTKKGKAGKPVFNYSMMYGKSWMQDVPQRMALIDEATYANLSNKNAGLNPAFNDMELDLIRKGTEYYVNPADTNSYIYLNQKSFVKQLIRDYTDMQSHNLSVRGGTDKVNYLVSLGLMDQQGAFRVGPDKLNRYNARINLGIELTKHLSIETRLAYTNQQQEASSQSASTLMNQTLRYRSRWPIFTPEGRLSGAGTSSANMAYAHLMEGGYNNYDNNNFDGVFTVKVANLVKGLQARAVFGGLYGRGDRNLFRRTITTWQRYAPVYYVNNPNSYEVTNELTTNKNLQFILDYDLTLGKNHVFHAMAGHQYEDYRYSQVFSSAKSLASNDLPALNLGDDATKVNSQAISTYANRSYFGRINYSFADKYLFEATLRADETSRLPAGSRLKVFPAVSAGWNINSETWFPRADFISALKLRASWGQLGSALGSVIGNYDYLNMLTRANNLVLGGVRSMYFYQNILPSPTLTWETIETSNIGLDFALFKNRLTVSADYYVKYNKNMLTPQLYPSTIGINTSRRNNGELKSWGWELDINHKNTIGNGFNYNIGFNLSDNQNKLLSYSGQKIIYEGITSILEGYPLNSIWGFKTDGFFQDKSEVADWAYQNALTSAGDIKYLDLNGDKVISVGSATPEDHGDLVYLGSDQPRYTFGITGGLSWKGIDLSVFFQGVGSRTFFPNVAYLNPQDAQWNNPMSFQQDYWTEDNRDAYFPRPYVGGGHNYRRADKWILNGRYIRLKNLQMGYSLPAKLTQKAKISNARIFVSGQDLLTFSGLGIFKGVFSPEFSNNTSYQYPLYSNVSVGLNLNF
ncbi:SusC/RagA family TonB-linked outer membrane protein [Dyadobacter sp. 32]|uniref:SusC/RagA family TonB-linked outer membrane protein n=1 Tax=Dyadobacter sp. 32 TaxID=538966 RepID=UPI0011ECF7A0